MISLVDPGFSMLLNMAVRDLWSRRSVTRVLPYLAPEQTGRMGRDVDWRCDFYALGVTFYELLTGAPPFQMNDALTLLHAQLAERPRSPQGLRRSIPETLGAIILKLLEKDPENRYQSATGLRADLERCRDELHTPAHQ